MNKTAFATCFVISIAYAVTAQAQGPGRGGFGHEIHMLGIQGGRPGTVVTGAPFSGQEVTTETQTLANGTHIQHTNTAQFYRDAEGRTRIERSFSGLGSLAGGESKTTVEIFDNVGGFAYFLNPSTQTATKMALPAPKPARRHIRRTRTRTKSPRALAPRLFRVFLAPALRLFAPFPSVRWATIRPSPSLPSAGFPPICN